MTTDIIIPETGIERYWREVEEAKRAAEMRRYTELKRELNMLAFELFPQQWHLRQQQNVGMGGVGNGFTDIIEALIGPIGGQSARIQ